MCVDYCYACVHRMLSRIYTLKNSSPKKKLKYLHNKYVGDFIFSLYQLNWFFNELVIIEIINRVCISSLPFWVSYTVDRSFFCSKCSFKKIPVSCLSSCSIPIRLVQRTSFSHFLQNHLAWHVFKITHRHRRNKHISTHWKLQVYWVKSV